MTRRIQSSFMLAALEVPSNSAPAAAVDAASQFSRQVTRLSEAGWHLRDIEHDALATGTRISLTLADEGDAKQLSMEFNAQLETFERFLMKNVGVATEQRVQEEQGECGC